LITRGRIMSKPKVNSSFKPPSGYNEMFFGASNGVGILPTVNSGFRTFHPEFDYERCIKCMFCWIYCPEGCIDKTGKELTIMFLILIAYIPTLLLVTYVPEISLWFPKLVLGDNFGV